MLVFQYGSNCSDDEINSDRRLRGDAKFVDIAQTVQDFELAFDVWSTTRGCAASDIVRKPGDKVWGVLYEVPDCLVAREKAKECERRSLDGIEGANYRRETIEVHRLNGKIFSAQTYIAKCPITGLRTNADYVGLIVRGLRERGVPVEYIAKVKAIAAANNPDIAAKVERP